MNTSSLAPNIQKHRNAATQGGKWPCVMIDIETLATSDDATILEIGVVCFDLEGRKFGPCDSWQLDSLAQEDRLIDPVTVRWWLDPARAEAFSELTGKSGLPELWHGLNELSAFLGRHLTEGGEVWAKGDFDLRILGHAFVAEGVAMPWKYFQARELRSVLKWMGVAGGKTTAHRAEEDAKEQVRLLWDAHGRLTTVCLDQADWAAGWDEYREELAATRGNLLPTWDETHGDVKEAWCAGVRAVVEANAKWAVKA